LASPDLKAAYEAGGRQIMTGSPGAMADKIAKDIPRWRAVIKASNIKAE
jgi:tripartite-type tricarboxylate transporter receptor subunit TctC